MLQYREELKAKLVRGPKQVLHLQYRAISFRCAASEYKADCELT